MKNSNIFSIILACILLVSCSGKGNIKAPNPYIKENKMLEILTDVHRTEGIMRIPSVGNQFAEKDSVQVYMEVIEKHGYTKEEFDANIDYYFIARPKTLNSIYDKVLEQLSRLEDEVLKSTQKDKKGN